MALSNNQIHNVLVANPTPSPELTHYQTTNSKLKEIADDNFKFYENGSKLSKQVENIVEVGEIARYEQFLLFPQCFQKVCFQGGIKRCHCVGMG